ncbi:MAG: AtzH-like domain-containing protein [Pseudomonadota bacterium]
MTNDPLEINAPAVVLELTAIAESYEAALVSNDVAALTDFFWEAPEALRFGVAEELYGSDAIAQFRKQRGAPPRERVTRQRTTLTLGQQLGVTTQEFNVVVAGPFGDEQRHGRQTQVWARFAEGWRIVSAHVSHRPEVSTATVRYAQAAAALTELSAAAGHSDAVAGNLATIAELMGPLMAFELDDQDEIAGVFRP